MVTIQISFIEQRQVMNKIMMIAILNWKFWNCQKTKPKQNFATLKTKGSIKLQRQRHCCHGGSCRHCGQSLTRPTNSTGRSTNFKCQQAFDSIQQRLEAWGTVLVLFIFLLRRAKKIILQFTLEQKNVCVHQSSRDSFVQDFIWISNALRSSLSQIKPFFCLGRGGGLVVSVLDICSDDPSSILPCC